MHKAKRAIIRLALAGWLGFLGAAMPAASARAATPPERVLPDSTLFLFKIADAKAFREAFRGSHYGQLWNDPAMKEFKDNILGKLQEGTRPLKEKIGVDLWELSELPQGALSLAVIARDDPKFPVAFLLMADAGDNKDKMAEVLAKATKQAQEAGAKASEEQFNGMTIHILRDDEEKKAKEKDKEKQENEADVSVAWTQSESVFYFAAASTGTEVDVIKDLTAHREGRDNALAANDSFKKTLAKVDSEKAHVLWFLDISRVIKLALKASAKGNEGQIQQNEVLLQTLGVDGLKSAGGAFTFGPGRYDTLSKTFFLAPKADVRGLLKVFAFTPARLRPESWVPATVAAYQTMSWDFDQAYDAIEAVVNQFQPGMINLLEQQLVGPTGGAPLSLKKDLFGPIGNRVTVITDFKRPIKEDSQRYLLAVALENSKAFQETLNRIFEIAQGAPKKREFQGTTIYDVEMPNIPNPNAPGAQPFKGPISFAVAKDAFLVTTHTSLLEQILRPGTSALEENAGFQSVVKEMPEQVSGMTFVRPEESARLLYDLVKSGEYGKATQQLLGNNARGPRPAQVPQLDKVIPADKLPDFSVFAKYLTQGGSYSVMDDDGLTMTGFTLKHQGP